MSSLSYCLWQNLPFILTFLVAFDKSLAKQAVPSYSQHCGSIAPESSPTKLLSGASNSFLISNGFFSVENDINNHFLHSLNTNTSGRDTQSDGLFHFQPGEVHRTRDDGTLKLEGTLVLIGSRVSRNWHEKIVRPHEIRNRERVIFKLSGFWSESKGKLCMVGTGEIRASKQDRVTSTLSVILKLEYPKVSNITTSIIEGSIESLDTDAGPNRFNPIFLHAHAQRKYDYTVLKQADESCSNLAQEESVGTDSTAVCSNLVNFMRELDTFTSSDLIDFLEFRFLSVNHLVCSDDGKVHMSMTLSNENKPFRSRGGNPIQPGKSLVAEGFWDHHKNRLCLSACRLYAKEDKSSVVEDCSLSLTFWFPVTYSLKQRSTMVGRMWNSSDVSDNHADKITFQYSVHSYTTFAVPGLKYEYTELDRARTSCKTKNVRPKRIGRFPNAQSQTDMSFQLSIRDPKNGRSAWGDAQQISIGKKYHGGQFGGIRNEDTMYTIGGMEIQSSSNLPDQNREFWDVGYTIKYTIQGTNYRDMVDISAEGIYDSTTGTLCLVGCRRPGFTHNRNDETLNKSDTMNGGNLDCTFFIQLQLPSLDSREYQGKGMIFSTDNSNPIYSKPLKVTIYLIYKVISIQEYERMDTEVIMVIISLTALCVCSYLQLRHARKYRTIRSQMSIAMLAVLTVGCMVSLILKTESMLLSSRKLQEFLESGGWIGTTNAIARLITIVALIINCRLLQLAWGSRLKEELSARTTSRNAEKKSLMFCVPLYIVGALITWYVHSKFKFYRTILEDLARYVGLLVDHFLLPQIIFNMFSQSKERVLNSFFYIGISAVRVVPHIYNAYRAWWYPVNFFGASYIYADHDEDYYSTILDLIISFDGFLFVLLVYLQQRFGGRCFLPKRFKHNVVYEPVYGFSI